MDRPLMLTEAGEANATRRIEAKLQKAAMRWAVDYYQEMLKHDPAKWEKADLANGLAAVAASVWVEEADLIEAYRNTAPDGEDAGRYQDAIIARINDLLDGREAFAFTQGCFPDKPYALTFGDDISVDESYLPLDVE